MTRLNLKKVKPTKIELFLKQILYLHKKRKYDAKKIKRVLNLSYAKNILPFIGYIQKLISNSKKKKVETKNSRSISKELVDYIRNRTIEKKGLESSTKLSKIIENEFGKKISANVIRKYRFKL
ncbi:hypothetical protein BpHYR1_043276, partial [Brachionus plicatilis]